MCVCVCFYTAWLSAFVVERAQVADRLSVTVTLMLSAVAFRFVVSSMLPKVSYLTWMDYYILTGFVALILLIGENAFLGIDSIDNDTANAVDLGFAIAFSVIWASLHLFLAWLMLSENRGRVPWEVMDEIDKS